MGSIPEKLFVAARGAQEVVLRPEGEAISVLPAFIVPANSPNFVARANSWKRHYSYRTRQQEEGTSAEIENKPMSGIRIVGLSRRSSGGRAYKIIYPPNYLADLREGVLLEAMYSSGVGAGGRLNGEYVWSVNGSQMRLIRVGSSAHAELAQAEDLRSLKRISIKALKPGSIYVSQTKPPAIFLGHVSTIFARPSWNYNNQRNMYSRTLTSLSLTKRKAMLWYSVRGRKAKAEDVVESFTGYMNNAFNDNNTDKFFGRPSVETGHSMKKEIGSVELPHDVVLFIRDRMRDETIQRILRLQRRTNQHYYYEDDTSILISNSPQINMVPYGENPEDHLMREFERILS